MPICNPLQSLVQAKTCHIFLLQKDKIQEFLAPNKDPNEIAECLRILQDGNTTPALSCGMHPGLVDYVTEIAGNDYLANAGGAVHGHPGGTIAGARAMRQAIDHNYQTEYDQAIAKWGKV
jgi:ribulose 1,5-bisphosphate carboxylase large subunit-like protein